MVKSVSTKFLRTLGVGLVGLLAFLLFVFFVTVFFAQHRGDSRMMLSQEDFRTDKSMIAPSATISAKPLAEAWDGAAVGMLEKKRNFAFNETDTTSVPATERKVIKSGNLNVQVKSVDEAVTRISTIANDLGGMVTDTHVDQMLGGLKSGSLVVKVEAGKFDEAVTRLKEVAVAVTALDVSAADVTAQVIDLEARINNKKAAEATLQTLFERAVKVSDVMEITDRLALVRSEIESLEGQMRYYQSQTDMASLTVRMTEDVQVAADQGFRPLQTFKESLFLLVGLFGDLFQGLIRLLIVGLPVLLINGFVLWVLYRLVRKGVMKFWPGSVLEKKRVLRKK